MILIMYKLFANLYRLIFVFFFRIISKKIFSNKIIQPTLIIGSGEINIDKKVVLGVIKSPNFFSYGYIESRSKNSSITICENVTISNGCEFIAENANILVNKNTIIGMKCSILTSDFHKIGNSPQIISSDIIIESNVFIGNNVTILKGVTIGEGSVIGNSCVVTKNVPSKVIYAGNPGKVVKYL